jgi:hypothetical protein
LTEFSPALFSTVLLPDSHLTLALLEQVTYDTFPVHRTKYYNYIILYAIIGSLVNSEIDKKTNPESVVPGTIISSFIKASFTLEEYL